MLPHVQLFPFWVEYTAASCLGSTDFGLVSLFPSEAEDCALAGKVQLVPAGPLAFNMLFNVYITGNVHTQ